MRRTDLPSVLALPLLLTVAGGPASAGDRHWGQVKGPRDTDWRLADFDLPPVTRAQAIKAYKGDADEAEQSLVSIMVFANRGIAHITDLIDPKRFGTHHLEIASRGIHALVVGHLYRPLGRAEPPFGFPKSKRHL
jgi:hypothetical protein